MTYNFLDLFFILFLLGVIVVLFILIMTIVMNVWFKVPYVPTPVAIVQTMLDLAALQPGMVVYDLGAGDGRFLLQAKKRQPNCIAIGYEGAFGVWIYGKIRIYFSRLTNISFYWRNFFKADLRNADVIFVYLTISMMKKLLPKFQKELRPGTKIISHAFKLPDLVPVDSRQVPMTFGGTTNVYLYVWK